LITNYDSVTGVVSALIANNVINAITQQVGSFTLAFVAPLSAK
jgi:ATP/ADP translocase